MMFTNFLKLSILLIIGLCIATVTVSVDNNSIEKRTVRNTEAILNDETLIKESPNGALSLHTGTNIYEVEKRLRIRLVKALAEVNNLKAKYSGACSIMAQQRRKLYAQQQEIFQLQNDIQTLNFTISVLELQISSLTSS